MSGELEFEDIFYGDTVVQFPVTAHIIFLSFVLLVTVILTNLMVGLAVSDIQGLQVSASLDRLVRQAELVSRLESLFFSRLLRGAPTKLLKLCKRSALLRTSRNKLQFIIRPNDPRDNQLPEDIKLNIYKLVAERRDRNMSMRRRKFESNYSMFQRSLQRNNSPALPRKEKSPKRNNASDQCELKLLPRPEHEQLLRPRSATNVPNTLMGESELAVKLKNQVNGITDIRAEIQVLKTQVTELTEKFDKFTESAGRKLNFAVEELCRIKMSMDQKSAMRPERTFKV